MFTKDVKEEGKRLLRENTDTKYLPGILFSLIPLILLFIIQHKLLTSSGILKWTFYIILSIISTYLTLWLQIFCINLTKGWATIKNSIPKLDITLKCGIPFLILLLANIILDKLTKSTGISFSLLLLVVTTILSNYIHILVVSYMLNNKKINFILSIKVLPEIFVKQIVLILSFIPLILLFIITLGIASFWKVTYINASGTVLVTSIYKKYENAEQNTLPVKYIIISLIILLCSILGIHRTNSFAFQNDYKIIAYNGVEYDIVTEGNNIVAVRFPFKNNIVSAPDDISKDIIIDGKPSYLYAIYAPNGYLLGINIEQDIDSQNTTTLSEILKGAKSSVTGIGMSF